MRRVTIFTGSTPGNDPAYVEAAYGVGRSLAERGVGVVYGAGGSGLMGAVAQGALDAGGEVIGVIPEFMIDREWGRGDLTRVVITATMHERKARMAELSDAFLALPGGLGTLEEIFEVWTWRQLGLLHKPVGFLNLAGFWNPLIATLQGLVDAGFVAPVSLTDLVVESDVDAALRELAARARTDGLRPGS